MSSKIYLLMILGFLLIIWKPKKCLEKVLNAKILRGKEHEDSCLNFDLIIPIHGMDDTTVNLLPNNIPDDIKEEIILNARLRLRNNLIRKGFNTSEYNLPINHALTLLTINFSKRGIILRKSYECLHFTMFKLCLHCPKNRPNHYNLQILQNMAIKHDHAVTQVAQTKHKKNLDHTYLQVIRPC